MFIKFLYNGWFQTIGNVHCIPYDSHGLNTHTSQAGLLLVMHEGNSSIVPFLIRKKHTACTTLSGNIVPPAYPGFRKYDWFVIISQHIVRICPSKHGFHCCVSVSYSICRRNYGKNLSKKPSLLNDILTLVLIILPRLFHWGIPASFNFITPGVLMNASSIMIDMFLAINYQAIIPLFIR